MSTKPTYLQTTRDKDVADMVATFERTGVAPAFVAQIRIAASLVFAEGAMAAFTTLARGHTLRELRQQITTILEEAAALARVNREKHAGSTTQEASAVRTDHSTDMHASDVSPVSRLTLAAVGPDASVEKVARVNVNRDPSRGPTKPPHPHGEDYPCQLAWDTCEQVADHCTRCCPQCAIDRIAGQGARAALEPTGANLMSLYTKVINVLRAESNVLEHEKAIGALFDEFTAACLERMADSPPATEAATLLALKEMRDAVAAFDAIPKIPSKCVDGNEASIRIHNAAVAYVAALAADPPATTGERQS